MNHNSPNHCGRYVLPEPMTDPPVRFSISGQGPPIREGPS